MPDPLDDLTEEDLNEITEDLHYQRLSSEFCGFCNIRHHPDQECQTP